MKTIKSKLLNELLLEKVKKEADPGDEYDVSIYDMELDGRELTLVYELEHKERGFILSNKFLVGVVEGTEEA